MCSPFVAELPNLTWQHVGWDVYLGVSHASHPNTSEFQRTPIFGVLLYLFMPTSFNAERQIQHGNTYG